MAKIKPQALLLQSKKKKAPNRISLAAIGFFVFIISLLIFCAFSTYRHFSRRSVNGGDQEHNIAGRRGLGDLKNPDLPRYVSLKTTKGLITVELLMDKSPQVIDKFIDLCKEGHFKGLKFRRVIKNFVIQAGGIQSLASEDDWIYRGMQDLQPEKSTKREAFVLGTSKRKKDLRGFELYITDASIPGLNEKLIVFGQVVKGADVIQDIEKVSTDEHYQPMTPIQILDVTLENKA